MSSFNLIDEQWIPVRFRNGSLGEMGIGEILARAEEVAAIEDQSPLVTAAIHRLLLAVLYRALEGPTDIEQARTLFRDGFPKSLVVGYLRSWREHFFLFDDVYPFWQVADYVPKEWRMWTVLATEHNADNAKVLFDHVSVESAGSISPASAARWLIAVQTFSVSAGKSELAHTMGAPSATALMAMPMGTSLQDTLLFNLVPEKRATARSDLPIWERSPDTVATLKGGPKRPATGITDLYTWRARAIRLAPEADGRVARVGLASGITYTPAALSDPMVPYRMDEKHGRSPHTLRDRGIWRDFDSLLPDDSGLAPQVISHAAILSRSDETRRSRAVLITAQAAKKAKIEFWRAERFYLPGNMSIEGVTRAQVKSLLDAASRYQNSLYSAMWSFARDIISRGDRSPDKRDIKKVVEQTGVTQRYWSALEPRFHTLLASYDADREFEDTKADCLGSIRDALKSSWQMHVDAIAFSDVWSIRAMVKAERNVGRAIGALESEIQLLIDTEVVA